MFEALPEPVLVIGAEGDDLSGRRVLLANPAARELFRIGQDRPALVGVVRSPDVLAAVEAALAGGERHVDVAGRGRQWSALARSVPGEQGAPSMALLHLRDVTEARALEAMRADFLANASHELRSPLASLTGFIETLRGPARDDAAARDRFLDIMAVQADRMGRLIADLLSLSRIELNEHVAPHGRADLALVAGDVLDALTPQLAARGVTVSVTGAGPREAIVAGDRDQIVQVLQNLIENAVKYSPDGGAVEIEITPDLGAEALRAPRKAERARHPLLVPEREPARRYAAVRVADHGPGIARQHLPRLAERFYRVEGQKSGDRLGTGLGLAIAKHIINRHRGGLVVESAPGEGAAFTVYLPRADGPEASDRNKTVVQSS